MIVSNIHISFSIGINLGENYIQRWAINTEVNNEPGNSMDYQLINLKQDIDQQKNLATEEPERLNQMIEAFEEIRGMDYKDTEELELH